MTFLSEQELRKIGLRSFGKNVLISNKASIYSPGRIDIGDHVRIDDFCVLSGGEGGIIIGNYVHVAIYTSIVGAGSVLISDFCNLSSRVSIYSSSDDYSGISMSNPTIPDEFKNVTHKAVFLGRHVIIGSGSVILPGVTIQDGVAVGALSLVRDDCLSFGVYCGIPSKRVKDRSKNVLLVERRFLDHNEYNEYNEANPVSNPIPPEKS